MGDDESDDESRLPGGLELAGDLEIDRLAHDPGAELGVVGRLHRACRSRLEGDRGEGFQIVPPDIWKVDVRECHRCQRADLP